MDGLTHIFWQILSEYISHRDHETAAHHLISELIDAGADEDDLWEMCKNSALLRKALKDELGDSESEEDYDSDDDD